MAQALDQIRRKWRQIVDAEEHIESLTVLKARAEYGTGKAGGPSDLVPRYIEKREKLLSRLSTLLESYVDDCLMIEPALVKMDPRDAAILRGYYCAGLGFEELAKVLRLDPSRVKHIKAEALREYDQITNSTKTVPRRK